MTDRNPAARFVVVGTGAISQVVHVPILAERDDVDLVAVSDRDQRKAEAIARRFGVPQAVTPEEAIERQDLDAVVICTPNHTHEDLAIQALESGKHVYVERPVAISSGGVERVLAAARSSGRRLVAGLPHRFRPEVAALRSFVASGDLGTVFTIRGSWLTRRVPVSRPTWRQRRALAGGGALVDLGVPALDLCLWMVDYPPVERVRCVVTPGDFEVEDSATVFAEADGLLFNVEVSTRYFAGHDRYHARVMGTEGSGSLPPLEVFRQVGGRPMNATPRQPRPRGGENPYTNAYRRQLDHFVRSVHGLGEAPLPHEQAILLRLIEAAYRSADEGREVVL